MNHKAFIAEFIGTFALVFIGVGAITGNFYNGGQTGLVGIALAHGLTIACMVTATLATSGGHLNPAVTIGLFTAKKINGINTVSYVIAQCLGAIVATFVIQLCYPTEARYLASRGTPSLAQGINWGMGLITEIILTFFLVFVVYATAVDKRAPKMGGLFIGLTVTFDILAGGPVTGACINPARYLGPALLSGQLDHFWLYWLGPILGGILAATGYKLILEEKIL